MPDEARVVIFDLDGTLLAVNSFPRWIRFLLAGRMPGLSPGRRIALSLGTARLLARRKPGRLDHEGFKARVQALWRASGADEAALAPFVASLRGQIRPAFAPLLARVATGEIAAVLATAAPADYAEPLGAALGFRHILATPSPAPAGLAGNTGAVKRDRVLALLAHLGWERRARVFFTDHEEDLPLILDCAVIGWFGPAVQLTQLIAPASALHPCLDASPAQLAALLERAA